MRGVTPAPTVQLDVPMAEWSAEFVWAEGHGVDQPVSSDPPLSEHVANLRLCAFSMMSKIIRAQPFFGEGESLES